MTLLEAGDEIVASSHLYGGTHNQLGDHAGAGSACARRFVDPGDLRGLARRASRRRPGCSTPRRSATRASTCSTSRAVAEVAHDAGVPLLIDNTFATPYLCRPIEHGADLVVPLGHQVDRRPRHQHRRRARRRGRFPWDDGRFPGLIEPERGLPRHALRRDLRELRVHHEGAGRDDARPRARSCRPFNAFLLLQGLETLSLRMDRHVANARAVAEFLRDHPAVTLGELPGPRRTAPTAPWPQRYLPRGAGRHRDLRHPGGREAGERFIEACELCSHLANVGDAKTLVIHPASTTHRRLDDELLRGQRRRPRTWCGSRSASRPSRTSSGTSTGRCGAA